MQISARNQFNGIVKDIRNGAVNSEVTVALPTGQEIVAAITCESVSNLGLEKGKAVVVLIKAGSVLIANNLDALTYQFPILGFLLFPISVHVTL